MTFPSSSGSTPDLNDVWKHAKTLADLVKSVAQTLLQGAQAGTVTGHQIVNGVENLLNAKNALAQLAGISGIEEYVRIVVGRPSAEIAADFIAMVDAITDVTSWIIANFPKDAGGYLLYVKVSAEGVVSFRTFSSAETAGLQTLLSALIAKID